MVEVDCAVGDRIEMVEMPEDPCPIPPGTVGKVLGVTQHNWGGREFAQIDVDWENGRSLTLIVPPDRFRVLA